MSQKPKSPPTWYAVEAISDGEAVSPVAEMDTPGGEKRPVMLHANFYDRHGNHVLQVVTVDMEAVPPQSLEQLRLLLQAQGIVPTLVLPDKAVKFMRLRALSEVESRRVVGGIKKAMRARDEVRPAGLPGRPDRTGGGGRGQA